MIERNDKVHSLRTEMANFEILSNKYNKIIPRLMDYKKFSYDDMLFKFWIPVNKFREEYYKDYGELEGKLNGTQNTKSKH
jgi:hypothetical protein